MQLIKRTFHLSPLFFLPFIAIASNFDSISVSAVHVDEDVVSVRDDESIMSIPVPVPPPDDDDNFRKRIIVKFKSNDFFTSFVEGQSASASAMEVEMVGGIPQLNAAVLKFNSEQEAQDWAAVRDDIEFIEHDILAYPSSATISISGEQTPYGIAMVHALDIPDYVSGSGIKMCIIDSGYAIGHEDLPQPSKSHPVTGRADLCGTKCDWKVDQSGHGTHVAGTIAATGNNNVGVVGVVTNNNMPLHIVRVFEKDSTSTSNVIKAMYDCEANGANVVNMSLGSENLSGLYQPALKQILGRNDKILFVAAAGNGGDGSYHWPASLREMVSVASVDSEKKRSSFSQYNGQVDIAAPGSRVLSTYPNGYAYYWGTSMATPHVAGVAAKIWSHKPSMTAQEVRNILESTAEDLGGRGRDNEYGWGLVDALAAYRAIVPTTPAPVTPAPTTAAPTTASPTTFSPTAAPSHGCEDASVKFLWKSKKIRCKRVANIRMDLCNKYRIKLVCPHTCQVCDVDHFKCSDATLPFYPFRDEEMTCKDLANLNPRQIKRKCQLPKYHRICRGTCGKCSPKDD